MTALSLHLPLHVCVCGGGRRSVGGEGASSLIPFKYRRRQKFVATSCCLCSRRIVVGYNVVVFVVIVVVVGFT